MGKNAKTKMYEENSKTIHSSFSSPDKTNDLSVTYHIDEVNMINVDCILSHLIFY